MYRLCALGVIAVAGAIALSNGNAGAQGTPTAAKPSTEWPTYGHDPGGMRFSPLTQINASNVAQLQEAWVYHMRPPQEPPTSPTAADGEAGGRAGAAAGAAGAGAARGGQGRGRGRGGSGFATSETTPIVVDGVMYLTTPYGRVVALDPTTGKEIWVFSQPQGNPSTRGVEYWAGDSKTPAQVVFGWSNGRLYSLHARTGEPNEAFGEKGSINLNTPEILRGLEGNNALSSPPTMYRHLIITGGRTAENVPQGPAGDVRAWDIHTGKLVWTFRSIPQAGEKFNDTWAGDSWKNRTGANVWGFITVDAERGIVYMPFGAPSIDQYGGDRHGDNLFSSSIVAADANTGKYLWHFQVVHHDIWDADLAAAPVLLDVKQGGKTIPAVAVINKPGLLFLLDRVTGKPIYGVEERPVPPSEVPLERAAKTQPFPLKPAPLSRMTMTAADVSTVTPEHEAACRKLSEGVQLGGPYLPQGYNRLRVQFPGNHGGVNWGGVSFNPQLGYLFVNTNEFGQMAGIKDRDPKATGPAQPQGVGNRVHPDAPYEGVPGGGRFAALGMPCQQPPWAQLTAVDVNTGEFAWRVPLGITESLPADKQNTGRPGNGGPIVTAGGLVFIGVTDDARFRAFDAKSGKELWSARLPAAGTSVPSTYLGKDGRQYVVVTATGGGLLGRQLSADSVVAFALPQGAK
jgi:quinoprotein glucose dehydrogenase